MIGLFRDTALYRDTALSRDPIVRRTRACSRRGSVIRLDLAANYCWHVRVLFTLTCLSTHLHPAQAVSVLKSPRQTSSVATNYETGIPCKYSKVIWPCGANLNEHAGENKNLRASAPDYLR